MTVRNRPVVVSTRASRTEMAMLRLLAEQEGVSVAEVVYRLLMPVVRARVSEAATGMPVNAGEQGLQPA